jgi:RimJ/RimL family protein N-acetyltransferase
MSRKIPIPKIATERLLLCPPCSTAESAYERFFMDARASNGYGGAPLTADGARARLAADLSRWDSQGFGMWTIQVRESGAFAGACGFAEKEGWPKELTWWLLPEFRGQGIAHEASIAAVVHAYLGFGWASVETYMKDENTSARALALRLGGVKVARNVFPDGVARDLYRLPCPVAA